MDCRSGEIYELQSEDAMQAFQKQFHEQKRARACTNLKGINYAVFRH